MANKAFETREHQIIFDLETRLDDFQNAPWIQNNKLKSYSNPKRD